jgi:hypothetical protein
MSDSEWNERAVNTHDGLPSRDERSFSSVSNQPQHKKPKKGLQIYIQFADTIGKEDIKVQEEASIVEQSGNENYFRTFLIY